MIKMAIIYQQTTAFESLPGFVLSTLHVFSHLILYQHYEVRYTILCNDLLEKEKTRFGINKHLPTMLQ